MLVGGKAGKQGVGREERWYSDHPLPPLPPLIYNAGVAQLVEHQPSKLRVAGSSPVARFVARVAQLVERILGKDEVRGSIPRASLMGWSRV